MGKIEKKNIFVVAKGLFENKLFLDSELYSLFPTTTDNILNAKWFDDPDKAALLAKKVGGEVIEFVLKPTAMSQDEKNEIDMLRASIKQLQKERDDAILELYKASKRKEN